MKKIIIAIMLLAVTIQASEEEKGLSIATNIGVVTNYIWRGQTQTNNKGANQGGLDIGYLGAYSGVWISEVDFGADDESRSEIDYYVGYTNNIQFLTYDFGYTAYKYAGNKDNDFEELYLGLDFDLIKNITFSLYGVNGRSSAENYYESTISYDIEPFSLSASYGKFVNIGNNYNLQISKTKKLDNVDLTLTLGYVNFMHDTNTSLDEKNLYMGASIEF